MEGILKNTILIIVVTLTLLFPRKHVNSSLTYLNYLHHSDISGHDIDLVATNEILDVRILPQCSFYCDGLCHMFAYDDISQKCRLYDVPVLSSIPTNGVVNPGLKYYSRKECPIGMYRNYTQCVSCPVGTYKNFTGEESCTICPPTYYQDETGQTGCKLCENSTDWRHGSNTDRTGCTRCWYQYNAYTEGDMNRLIKSIVTTLPYECAQECDNTPGCLLYTMRSDQGKCYLHSSQAFSWGYNSQSAIYKMRC